jgi:hypothetical protein
MFGERVLRHLKEKGRVESEPKKKFVLRKDPMG